MCYQSKYIIENTMLKYYLNNDDNGSGRRHGHGAGVVVGFISLLDVWR